MTAAAGLRSSGEAMGENTKPLHVVHVDDVGMDRRLFERHLRRVLPDAQLRSFGDPEDALAFLNTTAEPPDVIVTDFAMPCLTGTEVIESIREQTKFAAVPILVLSSSSREEDQRATRCAGADGYAVKFPSASDFAIAIRQRRGDWRFWPAGAHVT